MANAFLPTHVQLILVFINLIIYDHAKIFMTKRTDELPSGILPVCHWTLPCSTAKDKSSTKLFPFHGQPSQISQNISNHQAGSDVARLPTKQLPRLTHTMYQMCQHWHGLNTSDVGFGPLGGRMDGSCLYVWILGLQCLVFWQNWQIMLVK